MTARKTLPSRVDTKTYASAGPKVLGGGEEPHRRTVLNWQGSTKTEVQEFLTSAKLELTRPIFRGKLF